MLVAEFAPDSACAMASAWLATNLNSVVLVTSLMSAAKKYDMVVGQY